MAHIKEAYWTFYMEGREDPLLKNKEVEDKDLVAEMLSSSGKSLRDTIMAACRGLAKPLEVSKVKRVWLEEHAQEITFAGGDQEAAFQAWIEGRVDNLAYAMEQNVLEELADVLGEDDEEESEEGDEDEDEEEDAKDDDKP